MLWAATTAALWRVPASRAQAYPSRPVRMIVPFPAGGPVDIVARTVSPGLGERLGQPIVVENRPGAAGTLGTEAVVRAEPDGHTLLLSGMDLAINAGLFDTLRYDVLRDLAPVGLVASAPMLLVVAASTGVGSMRQLLDYAREAGAKAVVPVVTGAPPHLATELFLRKQGLDPTRVPYKGASPAVADLAGGRATFMLIGLSASRSFIASGKVRPIAITGTRRASLLPEVPTFREAGAPMPELDDGSWWGLMAPRGVPTGIVSRIGEVLLATLSDAEVRGRFAALDIEPAAGTAAAFGELLLGEHRKWTGIAKAAGIRAE
jgi:tripartite-type tricarboxylate transporter receptor subunit TctC